MGFEIERKFLVPGSFPRPDSGRVIRQGYLSRHPDRTVRVRAAGDEAWLTIKGRTEGTRRIELEYAVPIEDATLMLDRLCEPGRIDKTRYEIEHDGLTWEVDVFTGDNEGLVVAEVELSTPEQEVSLPPWVGAEVSDDRRYLNSRLSERPYSQWNETCSVILYYDGPARARGEALAERLRGLGFPVRADAWSDARESGDPPLSSFSDTDAIHVHPTALARAELVRTELVPSIVVKEGDVVGPGSRWSVGPRSMTILLIGPG